MPDYVHRVSTGAVGDHCINGQKVAVRFAAADAPGRENGIRRPPAGGAGAMSTPAAIEIFIGGLIIGLVAVLGTQALRARANKQASRTPGGAGGGSGVSMPRAGGSDDPAHAA